MIHPDNSCTHSPISRTTTQVTATVPNGHSVASSDEIALLRVGGSKDETSHFVDLTRARSNPTFERGDCWTLRIRPREGLSEVANRAGKSPDQIALNLRNLSDSPRRTGTHDKPHAFPERSMRLAQHVGMPTAIRFISCTNHPCACPQTGVRT